MIYIHVINNSPAKTKEHAVINNLTKATSFTRILKTSELSKGWRDINFNDKKEFNTYNIMIQMGNYNRKLPYHINKQYYGIDLNIDLSNDTTHSLKLCNGNHEITKSLGSTCSSPSSIHILYDILYLSYHNYSEPSASELSLKLDAATKRAYISKINTKYTSKKNKNKSESLGDEDNNPEVFDINDWSDYKIKFYYDQINTLNQTEICIKIYENFKNFGALLNIPNNTTDIEQFI
jgi:hypothetical protein